MKFEKFLKHCGARGSVVETIEGKFLKFAEAFFKIPEGVNVLSAVTIPEPDYLVYIFDDFREGTCAKPSSPGPRFQRRTRARPAYTAFFQMSTGALFRYQINYLALSKSRIMFTRSWKMRTPRDLKIHSKRWL